MSRPATTNVGNGVRQCRKATTTFNYMAFVCARIIFLCCDSKAFLCMHFKSFFHALENVPFSNIYSTLEMHAIGIKLFATHLFIAYVWAHHIQTHVYAHFALFWVISIFFLFLFFLFLSISAFSIDENVVLL